MYGVGLHGIIRINTENPTACHNRRSADNDDGTASGHSARPIWIHGATRSSGTTGFQ
jgi:hypothetical protein